MKALLRLVLGLVGIVMVAVIGVGFFISTLDPNDHKEWIIGKVEKETGRRDVLQSTGTTRQIVMASLYKYGGLNNREIGELLGVDYTTVSQGRKRLREKSEKDQEIKSIVEKIDLEMSRIKI